MRNVTRRLHRRFKPLPAWQKHFDDVFAYADWVEGVLGPGPVGACFVHDALALEAGRRVRARTGCKLIYDAVEYPDYTGRPNAASRALAASPESLALVTSHERAIAGEADLIVVGSPDVQRWFETTAPGVPGGLVRNCLDYVTVGESDDIRRECGLSDGDRLVIFPNNIYPHSGFYFSINALAWTDPRVHLAVAKPIPVAERFEVLAEIKRLGLTERVHFLERRAPQDLIRYRSGADLSVIALDPTMPSFRTSLPNRFFESIMSRTPIVASMLPNIARLIQDYDIGEVFEPYEPKELADALERALDRRTRYRDGLETAARELCWDEERARFLDLVEPVLPDLSVGPVVFLAFKDMRTNQRVFRFTRTLAESGRDVALYAAIHPRDELRLPNVSYRAMEGGI